MGKLKRGKNLEDLGGNKSNANDIFRQIKLKQRLNSYLWGEWGLFISETASFYSTNSSVPRMGISVISL